MYNRDRFRSDKTARIFARAVRDNSQSDGSGFYDSRGAGSLYILCRRDAGRRPERNRGRGIPSTDIPGSACSHARHFAHTGRRSLDSALPHFFHPMQIATCSRDLARSSVRLAWTSTGCILPREELVTGEITARGSRETGSWKIRSCVQLRSFIQNSNVRIVCDLSSAIDSEEVSFGSLRRGLIPFGDVSPRVIQPSSRNPLTCRRKIDPDAE